ncbi:helix-turn-helix domain-containing protein [Streptomyces thermocarboxydus]
MQWSEYSTAERLKRLRGAMTQEQLAEAANVSVGVVRKLERGGTASFLRFCPSPLRLGRTSPCSSANRRLVAPWTVTSVQRCARCLLPPTMPRSASPPTLSREPSKNSAVSFVVLTRRIGPLHRARRAARCLAARSSRPIRRCRRR